MAGEWELGLLERLGSWAIDQRVAARAGVGMAHKFKQGWFSELSPDDDMWPGQALSLEVSHSTLSCAATAASLVANRPAAAAERTDYGDASRRAL